MKNNCSILTVLILVIFVSSCSLQKQRILLPELQHVENIMYQFPDSALTLLEQMKMPNSSDKLNHATWCLFLAQAKYKNFIKQPSDSLIHIAYDYFMEQDNPQRKALVLYLEGAINRELDEAEKATQFYLLAIDEVEKTKDYQLGHLIYAGLGDVYIYRDLDGYAEEIFEQSYLYANSSGNKRYIANSLLSIARLYATREDWNMAIKYYKEAINMSESNGDKTYSGSIMMEMSSIYSRQKDYVTAFKYAQKGYNVCGEDELNETQVYLILGNAYRLINKIDSAYYYLNKATSSENIYTKRSAYGSLFLLSRSEKKYKEAVDYVEPLQICVDSIQKAERTNVLVEMQEKYNKEKLLNERNQLKIEKDRTIRTGLVIVILLLCIMVVIIYNYQRKLLQKERTIQKNEEHLRLYTLKVYENETLIARNESRIQELSREMEQNKEMQELVEEQKNTIIKIEQKNESLRKDNETLQENICQDSSTLREQSKELNMMSILMAENLQLQERERCLSDQLFKKTKVLNDLKVAPKCLNAAHWEEVKEAIDNLHDNYTKRLRKKMPSLTEGDLQLCCLIKLRLAIPEIAILLGISSASVSRRKLRLKERIIQELGEPLNKDKTLDLWLLEY